MRGIHLEDFNLPGGGAACHVVQLDLRHQGGFRGGGREEDSVGGRHQLWGDVDRHGDAVVGGDDVAVHVLDAGIYGVDLDEPAVWCGESGDVGLRGEGDRRAVEDRREFGSVSQFHRLAAAHECDSADCAVGDELLGEGQLDDRARDQRVAGIVEADVLAFLFSQQEDGHHGIHDREVVVDLEHISCGVGESLDLAEGEGLGSDLAGGRVNLEDQIAVVERVDDADRAGSRSLERHGGAVHCPLGCAEGRVEDWLGEGQHHGVEDAVAVGVKEGRRADERGDLVVGLDVLDFGGVVRPVDQGGASGKGCRDGDGGGGVVGLGVAVRGRQLQ